MALEKTYIKNLTAASSVAGTDSLVLETADETKKVSADTFKEYAVADIKQTLSQIGDVSDIVVGTLTDYGSSEYTLTEGKVWQTKGVTFLYLSVKCNTVSPISGGNHIRVSTVLPAYKKPTLALYPTMPPYKDASSGIGLQLQLTTLGVISVRGGEAGASYSILISY